MTTENYQLFLNAYEPIHPAFSRYCSTQAFGIVSTEDLMQEAVLITLEGFDRIRDPQKLLAYLIGIVNNLVKNLKRRQKFKGDWNESQMEFLAAQVSDPELLVDIQYLHQCIQQLPRLQREALVLKEICACTIEEIAAIQESQKGAVKTRIHRARQKLKKAFTAEKITSKNGLGHIIHAYVAILLM